MNARDYYNDCDPFAAEWLRQLIAAGDIPPGDVDERSIVDVSADDLRGYRQVHLFAGIGGWPLALRLAGWDHTRPVWTASCPCPPFSVAGKRQTCPRCEGDNLVWCPRRTGYCICADCSHAWLADPRHLWPEVWRLAAVCRPGRIYGEQVASVEGLDWLAGVRGSLEIIRYAVGAADLPAAGVGSPNIRQRLWWMAESDCDGWQSGQLAAEAARYRGAAVADGGADGLADGAGKRRDWRQLTGEAGASALERAETCGRRSARFLEPSGCGPTGGLGDASGARLPIGSIAPDGRGVVRREAPAPAAHGAEGFWDRYAVIQCSDGKARRIPESAVLGLADGLPDGVVRGGFAGAEGFPLAEGAANRVGRLRGYGNAINPYVAAEFIRATI